MDSEAMTGGRAGIVGGGFAGRQAACALAACGADVTVYDPRPEAVMLPALPDLAGGWVPPRLLTDRSATGLVRRRSSGRPCPADR